MRRYFSLLVIVFSRISGADDLLSKTDDELIKMYYDRHPDRGCIFWRYEARHFHKLLPQDSVFPDEVKHELIKKGQGLAGKNKEPETSVNYILKKKMFDMTVARSGPAATEVAVYNQCLKYEPKYTYSTQAGGHDPNPKLRSTDSAK